jgi:hypothetical protein
LRYGRNCNKDIPVPIKIALNPFRDPAEGLDWPEQATKAMERLTDAFLSYPDGKVHFSLREGEHGIGFDMPVLILEVLGIGTTLFFGIPALHKKIRETIEEWRKIGENVERLLHWVGVRIPVTSHSIEVGFYKSLMELQNLTDINNLKLIQAVEFKGKSDSTIEGFEYSPFAYYWFVFRDDDERLFLILMDSRLKLHVKKVLPLDYRILT